MLRLSVLSLVVLAVAEPASAQSHSLVGSWDVSYPIGRRMSESGSEAVMGSGSLRIVSQGDSLIGMLERQPDANRPARPPLRLAGLASQGEVVFTSQTEGQMNTGGETRTVTVAQTWKLTARGDTLSGTMLMRVEAPGMTMPPPQEEPVSGMRSKE